MKRLVYIVVAVLLSTLFIGAPIAAFAIGINQPAKRADRNYANFRVGASGATDRAEMCLELSPHSRVAFDWCGTGATWLHNDNAPDMMHMRLLYRLGSFRTAVGFLQPRLGAGIAEVAIGADDSGFDFTGVNADRTSTSGPEATASLRLLTPLYKGFELLTNLDATAGYFAHANKLLVPKEPLILGVTASVGFGF